MKEKPKTILVVDDDLSTQDLLNYIFKSLGHRVLLANSPKKAWKLILSHKHSIDLAYINIHFGPYRSQNGFDLAKKIKTHPYLHIPFYLMSMDSSQENKRQAKEVGCLRFLEKDFEKFAEELLKELENI